jgi:hypothetical protein
LFNKKSELQCSHYINLSTYPLATGRVSLGIRGAHFGNRGINGFDIDVVADPQYGNQIYLNKMVHATRFGKVNVTHF